MRSTLVCFFASIAAIAAAQSQQQTPDLTQFLKNQTNLTEFSTLVQNYGDIYAALSFSKDITIFAPSDSAFQKIPYTSLGGAFEANNSDIVREVLKYHVINGTHSTGSFNGSFQFLSTWMNNQTYSNVTGGQAVGVVRQAGNDIVCVSGLGSRSSLTASVRLPVSICIETRGLSLPSGFELQRWSRPHHRLISDPTPKLPEQRIQLQPHGGGWSRCQRFHRQLRRHAD